MDAQYVKEESTRSGKGLGLLGESLPSPPMSSSSMAGMIDSSLAGPLSSIFPNMFQMNGHGKGSGSGVTPPQSTDRCVGVSCRSCVLAVARSIADMQVCPRAVAARRSASRHAAVHNRFRRLNANVRATRAPARIATLRWEQPRIVLAGREHWRSEWGGGRRGPAQIWL